MIWEWDESTFGKKGKIMNEKQKRLRRIIIDVAYVNKLNHIGSALSCVDLISNIYDKMGPRDIFVLSKGHAALSWLAVLYDRKIITRSQLYSMCVNGSEFGAHVGVNKDIGSHVITGSLGNGLSVAAGIALGDRSRNVYVVCGDGECDSGLYYETARFVERLELTNYFLYVDKNGLQGYDKTHLSGIDGLDWYPIPVLTTKGSGVSFMQDNNAWHYKKLSQDEYLAAMEELK